MKTCYTTILLAILIISCRLPLSEDKEISDPAGTSYRLHLNIKPGSEYHYDIVNRTTVKIELEGNETENGSTSSVGINYVIDKDSGANYIFKMSYDKAHISTKNGDDETEIDAQNAKFSMNPAEKMLGALQDASLVISVSPTGDVKLVSGYKELSERLMADLDTNNLAIREAAQKQLDKIIGKEMIQKNLDQLFKMFPDSTIRIGDKWKIDSKQSGDFNLNVKSIYQLKDINDALALINSESTVESDNTPIAMMGYSVIPNLKGTQQGNYEVNTKTGMLMKGTVRSEVEGNIQLAGREVPIKIKMKVEIEGKQVK